MHWEGKVRQFKESEKVVEYVEEVIVIGCQEIFKSRHTFLVEIRGMIEIELLSGVKFLKTVTCKYSGQTRSVLLLEYICPFFFNSVVDSVRT